MSITRFQRNAAFIAIALLAIAPTTQAIELDFEGLPAGFVVFELSEGLGVSGGLAGIISVQGFNPVFGLLDNAAVIFDSSNPSGEDDDLGTPNEAFSGPGIGAGGTTTNDTALGNIIIVAEDLVDGNGDGLIDDPDDANVNGVFLEFDFSHMANGNKKTTAVINTLFFMDIESELGEDGTFVELSGPSLPVNLIAIPATGNNGVVTIDGIGLAGVSLMRVNFNGSGAFVGGILNEDLPQVCWFTFGGFQNAGIQSGGKDFTFGGNVGPPPAGSINVVDQNTGDHFHSISVFITDCSEVQQTGPGQPGGKKGFVINRADFAGTGRLNHVDGFTFTGYVIDSGEPGGKKANDKDYFEIDVRDGGDNLVFFASGELDGGNVQIHPGNPSL